jgi:hypothetical protein
VEATLPPVAFPTLGWQVIDWIEAFLCHGPGDVQGDDMEIDDEIALHICWAYRVWPQGHKLAGRRLVDHDVLSRPKGRAKSEIAGAIACAEALGPVRCDGFDAEGEPVGVPIVYPFIRCLATEEEQTGNTYDNVVYMLTEGNAADEYAIDVGLTRTFIKEPDGGEIVPSTSGDASKDGGKESFVVADETHLYVQNVLRSMYRTVSRNTGKRKAAEPWRLDTTTAWHPGEHSIAEHNADLYAELDLEDAITKKGVLYDHRQGDEPKRFGDDRSLIKALKTGYGPAADWMDFPRIVRLIREAEEPETEAYRYWLNRPRAAAEQWLSPEQIKAVFDESLEVEPGSMIAAGFDGSENDDHTGLIGCTEAGDSFAIGLWTPGKDDDLGWRAEVDAAVDWMFETFQVVRFYGDPPWWQDELGRWAAEYSDPTRKSTLPVAEFWTNVESKMAVASGALRTAIRQKACRVNPRPLRTEPQTRKGRPLLQWHFENAKTRKVRIKLEDRAEEAHVIRKDRPGSPRKIDGAVASILARRARDDALKLGEFVKKKKHRRASW